MGRLRKRLWRFLHWALVGDLQMYYENLRWQNWRKEIRNLSGDSVYTFFPFLCTEEGGGINQVSRKPIAIAEHYASTLDLQKTIL